VQRRRTSLTAVGIALARDHCLDHVLQDSLPAGLYQLVILGAGHDSRAHRFDLPTRRVRRAPSAPKWNFVKGD
jgi:O-methyltransferase involved in polyketide biosynthesis